MVIWLVEIMMSSSTWIFVASVILLLKYYLDKEWSVLKNINVPHDPPSIRNFGHAGIVWSDKTFTYELECKRKYGLVWGYYIGTRPRIILQDLNILRQVFIKENSIFTNRAEKVPLLGEALENGLLAIEDQDWKRVRATMTPAFSSGKLKQMIGIVDWCVNNTINVFEKKITNEDGCFVAKKVFGRLALDAICSFAFGTNVNSQDDMKEEPQISRQARKFFDGSYFNIFYLLGLVLPTFITPYLERFLKQREYIVFFKEVFANMRKQRTDNPDVIKRVDLMQIMLDSLVEDSAIKNGATRGMSEIEVVGNSLTMLLVGYHTTSITMSILAYNLAHHPEIQKQLQAEIGEMYSACGSLDYDGVKSLKFLEMCICESIRLYPPITRTTRVTKKQFTLANGLAIPPGILMVMPIHAFCHDPEYWEDPMEFKPERMRNRKEVDQMIFQPFGSGARYCIGKHFLFMETKLAFCKLLHQFSFETTEDTPQPPLELKFDVTIHCKVDFKLRIVPRNIEVIS